MENWDEKNYYYSFRWEKFDENDEKIQNAQSSEHQKLMLDWQQGLFVCSFFFC